MTEILPSQRGAFDIPRDVAYLNCAYVSPLSHKVMAAGAGGIAAKVRPWTLVPDDFFIPADRVRNLAAALLGGTPADYAFAPAASYGIATAALNLPLQAGQDIILLEEQFPSNVYSWQRRAEAAGANIRTVLRAQALSSGNALDWASAIEAAITPSTAIVATPHCHWADGSLVDLKRVSAACKKVGAALVLDLSQSAGALPIDIAGTGADFAAIASYKWLTGPYSLGLLYVAPHRQNGQPLEESWIGRKGSEDFAGLVDYVSDYQPGAQRFDMGERANFHLMPMLEAALQQLLDWGVSNIAATLGEKTAHIAAEAESLGLTSPPAHARAGHFLGLSRADGLPDNLVKRLAADNVFVSVRGTSIRVTPHLYNDEEDVTRFFAALKKCL
ncbi:MAG: aminotransferase class V-fold PLP-dependent enzyme [Rhodobiaceae bacterium]|nr:aminotransferase class V-fold PLP-dependent enzyme [Rhodobiaceae bacterium]MCC0051455.1 aminotransferase class V-fold PLP-dependent enzyme [Rhodobiaceae bacterium]MCC0062381.1 aminotransferase class V-fold PLP-dependent enzyme [Rhodobiaceae bacterium]